MFADPDLRVIDPKSCREICRSFSNFTLQCSFTPPALFVHWILPDYVNVNLDTFGGHRVNDNQIKNGIVTVNIDAEMKFASYACNVVYPGGIPQVSNTVQEEGTTTVHCELFFHVQLSLLDFIILWCDYVCHLLLSESL